MWAKFAGVILKARIRRIPDRRKTPKEELMMGLKNLFGWGQTSRAAASSACGSACGASGRPEEKPTACGSACGAGDKQ